MDYKKIILIIWSGIEVETPVLPENIYTINGGKHS